MTTEAKLNPIQRLRTFILEIQAEMQKVTWPSKEDLQVSTKVVCMLLLIMSVLTFFADRIFAFVVFTLLSLTGGS